MSWIVGNELYLLLGIGTLFNVLWLWEFKSKLNMSMAAVVFISIFHTVAGVLSVKVFAFLESGASGGMSLYGGIFFMPVLYYLGAKVSKRNVVEVFDVFTLCMIFTVMCARVNCWISGCCGGILIPGTEEMFWPTRQLEIIFYIILLIKLGSKIGKKPCDGTAYPIYMISYGLFRFVIEWLREPGIQIGIFHTAHIWSIFACVIGTFIYMKIKNKEEGIKIRKKEGRK